MLLYLVGIIFLLVMMPKAHRSLLFAGSLLLLCAFGAIGLSRQRFAAIAAIGVAALLSVAILAAFVIEGHLSAIVRHGSWHWQTAIAYSIAFMLYETPVAAFVVVWPLRRRIPEIVQA
jgi:hypothetical protein